MTQGRSSGLSGLADMQQTLAITGSDKVIPVSYRQVAAH